MTIFRSENIYRCMSALMSLINLSTTADWTGLFYVAVSEVEPFISHADALVDALEDSSPEKQCFRVLVGVARATSLFYRRSEVPDRFVRDIRSRLIQMIHAYRYVLPSFSAQGSRGDMS